MPGRRRLAIAGRDGHWILGLHYLSLACARLGDGLRAGRLYETLLPYAERVAVLGLGTFNLGSNRTPLGALAVTLGRLDEACGHLEEALSVNMRIGNRPYTALTLLELTAALLERGAPGDRERAIELLDRASEMIQTFGLGWLEGRASALRQVVGSAPAEISERSAARPENVFRRDGDYWTLAFAGSEVRLKDSKGLRDISLLLASPEREFHVADMIGSSWAGGDSPEVVVDAAIPDGSPLDPQARREYQARLEDLREELAEAERCNDPERATRARAELDFIAGELAAAYGLGGRPRRQGDPAERARKTVGFRIREAIGRIEHAHPTLGRHLRISIKTGTFCRYAPEAVTAWTVVSEPRATAPR